MKKLCAFILILIAILISTIAFADASTSSTTSTLSTTSAPAGIASILIAWITTNIFPLIATLVGTALSVLLGKAGIPVLFQSLILKVATNAVHNVEERAAAYLKLTGNKMDSSAKLNDAMAIVQKYTGIDGAEAADIVHAALGAIPDLGASAKKIETAITGKSAA